MDQTNYRLGSDTITEKPQLKIDANFYVAEFDITE
jgi:hypothetical protein